jgi:hypothetical protein
MLAIVIGMTVFLFLKFGLVKGGVFLAGFLSYLGYVFWKNRP